MGFKKLDERKKKTATRVRGGGAWPPWGVADIYCNEGASLWHRVLHFNGSEPDEDLDSDNLGRPKPLKKP